MALRADEDTLSPDEVAQHLDQPALRAHAAPAQFACSHALGTSGGRESAFLYVFDPAELLALLETAGMEARVGCCGEREVTSVFDFFPDRSSAEESLRRALAGETLHTLSEVGGRVFETHLMPVRNRRDEMTHMLCNVIEVTEEVHPAQAAQSTEEHIRAEKLLPTTQAQTLALLEAIPDRLFLLNREGVLLCSTGAADHLLPGREGEHITQIFPPPVAQQLRGAMQLARETRSVQLIEYPLQIGEALRFIETRVTATEQGEYVCLSRDISQRMQLEQALRTSEQHYRAIISHVPIILFTTDATGVITLSEGRGLQRMGVKPGQLDGLSAFEVFRDTPLIIDAFHRSLAGETVSRIIPLGEQVSEVHYIPQRDAEGHLAGVIGIVNDITERVQAEEAQQQSERLYHTVVSNAPVVLFALDAAGIYTLLEGKGLQAMELKPGQLVGLSALEVNRDSPPLLAALRRALAGETVTSLVPVRGKVYESRLTPLRDAEGELSGVVCVGTDVSERVQAEEALRHQLLHDPLTDLANRTLLLERVAEALREAEPLGGGMALLMLDLDRFKEINDTFGHQCGDLLLQQVGLRLRQVVKATATVARLGGDEFAVFLPGADEAEAQQTASVLTAALQESFLVEEHPLQVEASIGIALFPLHGSDPLTLLRHADVAMYTAKRGQEGCALYQAERDQYSPRRLALIGDLRNAIATHQLRLFYQPKADLHTGLVKSVEALVRWQHPLYGFIPPDQFIPLAEQTGLIEPLTRWVVETAIAQCRHWLDGGITLGVAVNLSMRNLREADLPDAIAELLAQYRVPPGLLYCEITESAAMADVEHTLQVLKRLVALGMRIAIDDYGTGYASLSYLKRLPADELKIDRAFVQHLTTDQADQAIVQSTVTMAHRLGMQVVAEGVEDQATLHLLASLGCDIAQGYYLSRPTSAPDLERWLAERKETVAL